MAVNEIVQLISNIGFTIGVCIICFWYINKKDTEHHDEVDKLREAIINNTQVMEKLIAKLGD